MYYRFYKNYLFLFVALYKTTTDQNVDTTRRDPIHYWDLPCGLLDLVENFTKLGVSARKKWAVNILSTLNRYIHCMVKLM